MRHDNQRQGMYERIIVGLFRRHYRAGDERFEWHRDEIREIASELNIESPDNLGDLVYSFRYRRDLPEEITKTAPQGKEWVIEPAGPSRYRFCLTNFNRILPRPDLVRIKIPDATPEIVGKYALGDEQALLAKLRYNRLLDIFLGVTTYSLQNHLRTQIPGMGQIEIDELYVGISRNGTQYVIPVQAKGGTDQLSVIQVRQDFACCAHKFEGLVVRAVAAQFMSDGAIAMFELVVNEGDVRVREEKHYELVPSDQITRDELDSYRADE